MASPTNLHTMLFTGSENVHAKLSEWVATLPAWDEQRETANWPIRLWARFTQNGTSGSEIVGDLHAESPESFNAWRMVEQLQSQITEYLGGSPWGTLTVMAAARGLSSNPGAKLQRTLVPGEMGSMTQHADAALLTRLLFAEMAEHRRTRELLGDVTRQQLVLQGESHKSMAEMATTRTATSSAADAGTFTGLLTLAALVIGMPLVRQALKLPKDADLETVVRELRVRVMGGMLAGPGPIQVEAQPTQPSKPPAPPPGAVAQIEGPSPEGVEGAEGAEGAPAWGIADVLQRCKDDPAWLDSLADSFLADPELFPVLKSKALAAVMS